MKPSGAQDVDGLFGPDSVFWRINRENVVLLAGPAAAVLQVAHPIVAKGVALHSRFREDAGVRLRRTLEAVYSVGFGSMRDVERVRDQVGRMHARVRGEGYSASDADAQRWVIATLVMGSVSMYERFVGKLRAEEKEAFLLENWRFAEVFGMSAENLPGDWDQFLAYWDAMVDGSFLGSIALCGEVAREVVFPSRPILLRSFRVFFPPLAAVLIPRPLFERLGLACRLKPSLVWTILDRILPRLVSILPNRLRFSRHYLRAVKRSVLSRSTSLM